MSIDPGLPESYVNLDCKCCTNRTSIKNFLSELSKGSKPKIKCNTCRKKEDKNWSGLDMAKVNDNEIKSLKRHVKSRFYFTCSSHMYALLNVIGFGYNSFLTQNNRKSFEKIKKIFDLDYCSHIIFRLFENMNFDLQNPNRYRLEIIMSPGSNRDPREANE